MTESAVAQLRTIKEVRSLSYEEADSGKEVDITGVVIFSDPPATIFIQDETAGTFFQPGSATPPMPGDVVRIRGNVFPGLYLPGINRPKYEVIRHEGLPESLKSSFDDLISGRFHYQRVAIEGIVRSVSPSDENPDKSPVSLVQIAMGSRMIEVRVEDAKKKNTPLVGSRVRVSGLAVGHINKRRQLVLPYLRTRNWLEFEILEAAPDPKTIPTLSARQLLNFKIDGQGGHQVRVKGDVLAVFPEGEIFLRDADSAIKVKMLHPNPDITTGLAVEIIGFPEMKEFSASLAYGTLAVANVASDTPLPVNITPAELMTGNYDANLVTVTGLLRDWYRVETGGILVLEKDGKIIQAHSPFLPESTAIGSLLKVTGICEVKSTQGTNYNSRPDQIILRLRSDKDLVFLKEPEWWNARRLATVMVLLLVAVLMAALWIALLRRQVASQTKALRNRIKSEAALEERQRLAREFHDTLEQEMAGLSIRLDAAVARCEDDKMQGLLEGSRGLVRRVQAETRNLVADLRDHPGEFADLKSALEDLVKQQAHGDVGPEIELDISESIELPSRTVHHLSMIAREAVTNALKHAQATKIIISVEGIKEEGLRLKITDNGKGFDVEKRTGGVPGHFGCIGIQERCARIAAKAEWNSQLGEGCTVTIQYPLTDT